MLFSECGFAKEKTLEEVVTELKEKEQVNGSFLAKVDDAGRLRAVHASAVLRTPEDYRVLAGVESLESLTTGCVPIEVIAEIGRILPTLPNLQKLSLTRPTSKAWPIEVFQSVSALKRMRQLRFGYVFVPDGGLKQLAALPELEVLELFAAVHVAAKDLADLEGCPKLAELNLRSAKVDDSAIPALLKLKSLKLLDVNQTEITGKGRESLMAAGIQLVNLTDRNRPEGSRWRPWME